MQKGGCIKNLMMLKYSQTLFDLNLLIPILLAPKGEVVGKVPKYLRRIVRPHKLCFADTHAHTHMGRVRVREL